MGVVANVLEAAIATAIDEQRFITSTKDAAKGLMTVVEANGVSAQGQAMPAQAWRNGALGESALEFGHFLLDSRSRMT